MVKNAIEFQHISFQYADGNTKVLKDVNFSIPFGSVTLLTGRTGVGKTTLLRILTRVIPEDVSGTIYGNILVDGETIAKNNIVDVSKKIGFVMQDPECQIFHEDVHDELLFGMENNNVSKEEAYRREKEALDYTHLDRNSKTKTLSGGQKAMLITQSIILMRQNIIVLDEPLANLDLENALKLLVDLKRLAKEGKAIIICEHRTSLVLPFCDKIYHLDNGIMYEGTGDDDKPFVFEGQKTNKEESNESILKIDHLNKSFDDKKILNDLYFNMKKERISVILGNNGQGKTTLLNCISGQMKVKKKDGQITQSIAKRIGSYKWFKKVSVVFQNPTYELFNSSVRKELCFHSYSKDFAMEIGSKLHLEYLYDRHPQSLSEGEKRKLTIACALAKRPDLLFLDEPTVGQDRKSLENIIEVIKDFVKEYKTSVYLITHDEQAAKALADDIYLLKDGKLNRLDSVEEFFDNLRLIRADINKNNQ